MRKLVPLFAILLFSCGNPTVDQVELLEGYWQIDRVKMEDGSVREYPVAEQLDYYELEGSEGKKYRLTPRYDGKFVENGKFLNFRISTEDDRLLLIFRDSSQSYQQEITKVSEDKLTLVHKRGITYYYSRYEQKTE